MGVYHKSSESQTEQWREGGGGQVPSGSDQVCGENDEGEERRGTAHFTGSEYTHTRFICVVVILQAVSIYIYRVYLCCLFYRL